MRPHLKSLALAVLLVPAMVAAQGSGELRGTVKDSSGAPVPLADVVIEPGGQRVRTDESGTFRFRSVPARRVALLVRRIGFTPYQDSVMVERGRTVVVDVKLSTRAQVLSQVRVMDQNVCDLTSLEGFECRRNVGVGFYRDEAELIALNARNWADLLDGIPTLRRRERLGPMGVDWMPAPMPSRCLRRVFNGQPELNNYGLPRSLSPDDIWQPEDVVALEYYDNIRKVPSQYQRFAWPREEREGCGLIVYWLKGASTEPPESWRRNWTTFGNVLRQYGMQGMLENNPDPISFNGVFTREVQWRGVVENVTVNDEGALVRMKMPRQMIRAGDGQQVPMEFVEFLCPRSNQRCAGFFQDLKGKEIQFRTNLVSRTRDNQTIIRIVGTGNARRVEVEAYNGSFLRIIER
jgi:hypothetical protein